MAEPIKVPLIYEDDLSGLVRAQQELTKTDAQTKELLATINAYSDETIRAQEVQIEAVKQASATLAQVAKLEATIALSKAGSYNSLNAQLQLNQIRLKQLTEQEIKTTKEGKALVSETAKLKEQISSLTKEQTPLNTALGKTLGNLGEMRKELLTLRNTSFAGKTQEDIDAINQRIGELVDGISDLRAVQAEFGNEFGSQIAGSLQVVTAGVEGVVASLNLLGIESEALKNLQNSVVDLIAVTQALGAIEDALAKGTLAATAARIKNTVATAYASAALKVQEFQLLAASRAEAAKTVAANADTIATRAAATAQWLWNAALTAFPAVAIVAGIAAITAGIIALTSYILENREATRALESDVAKLAGAYDLLTSAQEFQLSIAQETGKEGSKLTKLQQQQTEERIDAINKERTARLKLLEDDNQSASQQEENHKRLQELSDLELEALDERILLQIRYSRQLDEEREKEIEDANRRKKERDEEAKRLKAERERRKKEREDSILQELEAQKQFDLARLDAERDYLNTSTDYNTNFNAVRLATEQAAQVAILDKQREFGRITETEYKAGLERIKADLKKFAAELPLIADPGASLRRNIEAAFSGIGGDIAPLENIFEANAEKDILQRAQKIGGDISKSIGDGAKKGDGFFGRLLRGESLGDVLGISSASADEIKGQLQNAFANIFSGIESLYQAQITQQDRLIAKRNESISSIQEQLKAEQDLKNKGFANDYDTLKAKLDAETKLLQAEEEKRLELEKKAAQIRLRQESLQVASNIALSVAKVIAAESGKGLLGVVTAISGVSSIFNLIAKAKAQAAQFAKPEKLRKGAKLKGATHEGGGIPLFVSDESGGRMYEAERDEWLIGTKPSMEHDGHLAKLNNGHYTGMDLDRHIDFASSFFQDPQGMIYKLAPKFDVPVMPDFMGGMLPRMHSATTAIETGRKLAEHEAIASAIGHYLGQVSGGMDKVVKAIKEKPTAIPITPDGYIEKTEIGNTTTITHYKTPNF